MCQPLRRYTRILSAGFCSWGSGKVRPFPHVNHGDALQNNIAEEQRYFFSDRSDIWRLRHSASSGHHRLGKTTHREVVVPGQQPPGYVRGGQVTDREESHVKSPTCLRL
jgi:hypothetical protein